MQILDSNYIPDIVIYHANCSDGFASKFVCMKKWGKIPLYLSKDHPSNIPIEDLDFDYEGKHILFVDFVYDNVEIMKDIQSKAASLYVIDHHCTALEKYKKVLNNFIFDSKKSASMITWDTLYPELKAPKILEYIQDRDMRFWKLPYHHEVLSVLDSRPKEHAAWKEFNDYLTNDFNKVVQEGTLLKEHFNSLLASILSHKQVITIAGKEGFAVNCPWEFASYAADKLAENGDFGMAWFVNNSGKVKCSWRSNNGTNVKKIAEIFGGGGHVYNAGATITIKQISQILGYQ